MTYGPLSLSRRHVLGDLYARCDAIENVPVFMDNAEGEMLGYVDESLGHYADAFCFHLSEDVCKKLSAGHFTYSFEYDLADETEASTRRRVRLNRIILMARKGYAKPVPKVKANAPAKAAAAEAVEVAEPQA
jgi:hypothetical protein